MKDKMPSFRPIETHYKGYRFRSRLEARWAVFFDNMGIDYIYEPEGFEMMSPAGYSFDEQRFIPSKKIRYLPDFYFPESQRYGEVKPVDSFDEMSIDDRLKIITASCGPCSNGILLFGNIPDPGRAVTDYCVSVMFPGEYEDDKGVYTVPFLADVGAHLAFEVRDAIKAKAWTIKDSKAVSYKSLTSDIRSVTCFTSIDGPWESIGFSVFDDGRQIEHAWDMPGMRAHMSLRAARSARFEYGEQP